MSLFKIKMKSWAIKVNGDQHWGVCVCVNVSVLTNKYKSQYLESLIHSREANCSVQQASSLAAKFSVPI